MGNLYDMGIYEAIAIADVKSTADLLRPVHDEAGGREGLVSLEVSRCDADDADEALSEARRLWDAVRRQDLLIEIPGIPANRQAISCGVDVDVSLPFSVDASEDVARSYVAGLSGFVSKDGDPAAVAGAASLLDAPAVDRKLDALADVDQSLLGRFGTANAKAAYQRMSTIHSGPERDSMASRGAWPRRLQRASTGTDDAALPDTYSVDPIIGRDTVNAVTTMRAFRELGSATSDTIKQDVEEAEATLAALGPLGICLDHLTQGHLVEGVRRLSQSFDDLPAGGAKRSLRIGGDRPQSP